MNVIKRINALMLTGILGLSTAIPMAALAQVDFTPQIQSQKLPSGQMVYVQEIHNMPIITIDTWVNTGSAHETKTNNGVSHFLEHLIFKGTKNYEVGEIDRILEAGGADFNAATSDDFTHYHITTTPSKFKEALGLHADMLLNATINTPELDRERKVVQEEINRALDNPDRKAYLQMDELLFPNHPYSRDTLGPKSNIQNIPRDQILGYYHQWYQPQNFKTIITGDVDTQDAIKAVQDSFKAALVEQKRPAVGVPFTEAVAPITAPKAKVIADPNVSEVQLDIGFLAPGVVGREDNFALDVGAIVLGQGTSSRLFQKVKEYNQLVETITSANMTQKQSGVFLIAADLQPKNREKAKKEILAQLQRLKEDGPTAEELAKAKKQVIKDYAYMTESTSGVAETIGYNVTIGKLEDYTQYAKNVEKVTAEDVKRAMNKYLDTKKAVMVELVPKEEGKTDFSADEKANIALLNNASQLQPLSAPKTEVAESNEVQKIVLKNGATLLLKPNNSTQTVAINIFAKGGRLLESKPGLASLTSRTLLKGTKTRTASDISFALEDKGISMGATSDEDYFQVTASSLTSDLPSLMLMLTDIVLHPTFPQEQINKQRNDALEDIKSSRDQPSSLMFEKLTLSLYPEHPYGAVGERVEAALPEITREDILSFYRQQMQPKNLVIAVSGRFNPEEMEDSIKQIILDIPNQTETAEQFADVQPLHEPVVVNSQKPEQAATWVAYGWLAPSISTAKNYLALKVINTMLGTGLSSRLFVDLREKQGLAYQVGSMYPSTLKSGSYVMYIGTDPKNLQAVQTGFDSEIQRLVNEPVSAQELEQVKRKLMGLFAMSHESNASQAYYMGFYETMGVGYKFDTDYPKLIESVTPADIQQAARDILMKPKVVSIVAPKVVKTDDSTLDAN